MKSDLMSVSPHALPAQPAASRRTSLLLTRDASWMRVMARAALCGWFLPLLMALLTAFSSAPAQAQAPIQTVVVLDFAVAPGLDPLLGRKAADGLAVELQRSGDFEVVTRQRVEEAVGQQAGLQPPFNDTAQVRLAQAVGARSVFSGRVAAVDITPGRAARVRLEVKQLDAATGDYINGTGVTETTEQKLQDVANEILVDEAINKSVFSAVRSVKQTTLPEGQVLNTTRDDVELSIGTRNGVAPGQRYTVLRDVFNRAKQITERVKIGELTIARVESDQSVGVLSAGGAAGIRTGDRIRKIFVTTNYPITSAGASGGSVTPVTAPPISLSGNNQGGIKGLAKKSSKGFLGLIALAGLVTLAGAGGGGGSSSSSPRVDQPVLRDPNAIYPEASISFRSGFTGIGGNLQGESVVGYLLYRGTTPGFAADINSLQAFVDGRNATSADQRVTVSDPLQNTVFVFNTREVTITAGAAGTGTGNGNVVINDTLNGSVTAGINTITESPTSIVLNFTQRPSIIGQTYYYRVGRITGERTQTTTGTGNNATTQVQLLPVRSLVSKPTGGFTPIVRPLIIRDQTQYNLDDFMVRINFDPTPYSDRRNNGFFNTGFELPSNANVGSGVNQFRVEVSTSTSFSEETTFTSPDLVNPGTTAGGDIIFNRDNGLGPSIRIPGNYIPGETPLFLRVLSRNTNDAVPIFRISPTLPIGPALGGQSQNLTSRFIASQKGGRIGGLSIRSRGGRTLSGGVYAPTRVLRPQ
ncbi:hypothetical protein B1R32_12319 [Abditibacterium utsteinense]|uniref:Curli production assembly/transport component CsgG n=1 Tax=Abditibacterium utsteinense TaxID=1960156 RepID=A0A2S8SPM8_9BACT|nr:hypothetical protein [Abditibacterium utsteinense]PQV62734.1 hypothetical protein B1R32_12319 [Abditibacterium utsteinense]